jgi:sortase A
LEIIGPAVRERSTVNTAAPIRHLWFEREGEPIVVMQPLAVGSDVEAATLRRGPGHYPSTALPGQPGNIGIAGHRTTFGAPFGAVDQLAANDTVHLLDGHGREWVYTFVASAIVDPGEVWVLANDALGPARDLVTLTTCHPRFSAARRLVVWAELVGAVDHR